MGRGQPASPRGSLLTSPRPELQAAGRWPCPCLPGEGRTWGPFPRQATRKHVASFSVRCPGARTSQGRKPFPRGQLRCTPSSVLMSVVTPGQSHGSANGQALRPSDPRSLPRPAPGTLVPGLTHHFRVSLSHLISNGHPSFIPAPSSFFNLTRKQ